MLGLMLIQQSGPYEMYHLEKDEPRPKEKRESFNSAI